ncbi:hypothetical protein [Paraburkholderia bannensis]|nr:hypothetical protein [Paraburkholderia bannensis]
MDTLKLCMRLSIAIPVLLALLAAQAELHELNAPTACNVHRCT